MDATAGVEAPCLNISATVSSNQVHVVFHDNGPGIDEEGLINVFDPFYTTKPVGQGTGLGLSISYGIIEDHDGKLTARNHDDGGAIFEIELPVYLECNK